MSGQQGATILQREYVDDLTSSEEERPTVTPSLYVFPLQSSPSPKEEAILQSPIAESAVCPLSEVAALHPTADIPPYNLETLTYWRKSIQRQSVHGNGEALVSLLKQWLADDSGYDKEYWPELKTGIELNRMSTRKRFGD